MQGPTLVLSNKCHLIWLCTSRLACTLSAPVSCRVPTQGQASSQVQSHKTHHEKHQQVLAWDGHDDLRYGPLLTFIHSQRNRYGNDWRQARHKNGTQASRHESNACKQAYSRRRCKRWCYYWGSITCRLWSKSTAGRSNLMLDALTDRLIAALVWYAEDFHCALERDGDPSHHAGRNWKHSTEKSNVTRLHTLVSITPLLNN